MKHMLQNRVKAPQLLGTYKCCHYRISHIMLVKDGINP